MRVWVYELMHLGGNKSKNSCLKQTKERALIDAHNTNSYSLKAL